MLYPKNYPQILCKTLKYKVLGDLNNRSSAGANLLKIQSKSGLPTYNHGFERVSRAYPKGYPQFLCTTPETRSDNTSKTREIGSALLRKRRQRLLAFLLRHHST